MINFSRTTKKKKLETFFFPDRSVQLNIGKIEGLRDKDDLTEVMILNNSTN